MLYIILLSCDVPRNVGYISCKLEMFNSIEIKLARKSTFGEIDNPGYF